jgi:hypothetical protein
MIVRWLQERRRFGNILSIEISNLYPRICQEANVVEIAMSEVLKELHKITKKSRLQMKLESGRTRQRYAYFVPKPKAAKVVAIDRRQAS